MFYFLHNSIPFLYKFVPLYLRTPTIFGQCSMCLFPRRHCFAFCACSSICIIIMLETGETRNTDKKSVSEGVCLRWRFLFLFYGLLCDSQIHWLIWSWVV
ncbi:hypothetical protein K402DRAFT_26025 [Aulographum hederae CBS 113979]|uniref:Uncharacterized protein n=1 Tax=Aulographum hederae CBS 113979 TaxID=1176131 RepID=A0A6G1H5W2_9PEZI|nr:hypothetical protein K402DRAFT_26025 [Aulographum hederae CBS 113979]